MNTIENILEISIKQSHTEGPDNSLGILAYVYTLQTYTAKKP